MKPTQLTWVKDQLFNKGKVSRNQALRRYITRISARIDDLKHAGFDITGQYVNTKNGKDYVYYLNQK